MSFFKTFISTAFTAAYNKTFDLSYRVDGVDYSKLTQNNDPSLYSSVNGSNYRRDSLTRLSSFLGLSNRQLDTSLAKQTKENLWNNFIGYKKDASENELLARKIIVMPLNTIFILPKLLVNLLKLATEVIPGIVSFFLINLGNSLITTSKSGSPTALIGYFIWGLGYLFKLPYLVGCSLTSPIDNVRDAYYFGVKLVNKNTQHSSGMDRFIGTAIAFGAVCLSVISFSFALPLGLKALVVTLGRKMPTVILNVINKISNSPALTKFGTDVLTHPIIAKVSNVLNISAKLADVPAFAGIGYIMGATITTVGSIANYLFNKFKENYWHKAKKQQDNHTKRDSYLLADETDQRQQQEDLFPTDQHNIRADSAHKNPNDPLQDEQRRQRLSQDGTSNSSLFSSDDKISQDQKKKVTDQPAMPATALRHRANCQLL